MWLNVGIISKEMFRRLSNANLIDFANLLMCSDDSGDISAVSAVTTSASSCSYNVMAAAQAKYSGGNCNPLFQVCALSKQL